MSRPESSDKYAVAPDSEGLQTVPAMQQYKYLVGHRTSVEQPEAVPLVANKHTFIASYEDVAAHTHSDHESNVTFVRKPRKRYFGLPRTWFIILIISALIVITGAVVGGVLGSKSHGKTAESSLVIPIDLLQS